jgi:hypothetical protein
MNEKNKFIQMLRECLLDDSINFEIRENRVRQNGYHKLTFDLYLKTKTSDENAYQSDYLCDFSIVE